MKSPYKKTIPGRVFLAGLLFLVIIILSGCAGLNPAHERTHIKIKGKKEILVAKDIGKGGEIYPPRWCGNNGMAYRIVANDEVEMLDFQTGKRTPINIGPRDILLNCSPDGRKLFYLPVQERLPAGESDPGGYGWFGATVDMYMYDTVTGEKSLVASIKDPVQYDAISPDGTKILLGARHRLVIKKGAPDLKSVWFTKEWKPVGMRWFPDSSGVLGYGGESTGTICIEIFGEDGRARCFEIKDGNYGTDAPRADMKKRVYFLSVDFDSMTELRKRYLHRCEIKEMELSCERIIKDYNVMPAYGVLSDGDIIFQAYDDDANCIRRITPGRDTARCEITPRYGESVYRSIGLQGLSPDGRWLVFERDNWTGWKKRADGMGSDLWQGQMDLFVIDFMEE
ncbi:MAG: hypothetical protein ACE5EB_04365 [Thermodesulfobacteriota bacterium]